MEVVVIIRIKHLELENFRGEKITEIYFSDEPVTILYGRNGSGKTALLKIIHGLLANDEDFLMSEKITRAKIIFRDLVKERYFNIEATIKLEEWSAIELVDEDEDEDENSYEWSTDVDEEEIEVYLSYMSSIVFGVNRGTTSQETYQISPLDINRFVQSSSKSASFQRFRDFAWFSEFSSYINRLIELNSKKFENFNMDYEQEKEKNLMLESVSMNYVENSLIERFHWENKSVSEQVQKALFETMSIALEGTLSSEIKKDELMVYLDKISRYKSSLIEILGKIEDNDVSNKIKKLLSNSKVSEKHFKGKPLLLLLVVKMINELEHNEGLLNIKKLVDVFNTYLGRNKQLIINENGVIVKTNIGEHSINELSSGERHLLSFLTLFVINGNERNFWLIDEPEISLHLEWQKKLLHILTDFSPNAQIIVATHSPAIAEYGTKYLVELSNDKKKRK